MPKTKKEKNAQLDDRVELLPRAVTEEGPREAEWITRTLQGILGIRLEDLEEEVMFRW